MNRFFKLGKGFKGFEISVKKKFEEVEEVSRKFTREFQNFRFRHGVLSHLVLKCAVFLKCSWECISVLLIKPLFQDEIFITYGTSQGGPILLLQTTVSHFFL